MLSHYGLSYADKKWFAGFMAIPVMLIPYVSLHNYSRVELILPKFLTGMKHLLGCTYNSKAFCVFWFLKVTLNTLTLLVQAEI